MAIFRTRGRQPLRSRRFRGQSATEFALLSILFLTMTAGVVDLGRGVYARNALTNAVREGARHGATNPRDYNGMIAVAADTSPGLNLDSTPSGFVTKGGSVKCYERAVS
jgi:Flp pilus assembly protein TadG